MDRCPGPVLLTGASGYVGSHLLRRLAGSGHEVRALTRNPDRHEFPAGTDVRRGDAVSDAAEPLVALAEADDAPEEVQLGGADVLTYREMMARYADLTGRRRRPLIKVPLFTPRLSSYWVALVTPISLGLIQPLVEGLGAEMLVDQPPPPGINDGPMGFDDAVRAAL